MEAGKTESMPYYFRVDIDPEDLGMIVIAEYIDDVGYLLGEMCSKTWELGLTYWPVPTEKRHWPCLRFPWLH